MDLVMYRGDDQAFPLTITKDGAPLDLSAADLVFTARTSITATNPTFTLTSDVAGGIVVEDQMTDPGLITVTVPSTATSAFTEGTKLLCDVQVTIAGAVSTWPEPKYSQGTLIHLRIRPDVTHD